jgi:tRNA (cmo5U34)-methyltransferase
MSQIDVKRTDSVWKTSDLDRFFIENVQAGQPFVLEIHDIMVRIIRANQGGEAAKLSFLDLGCGNGFLSKSILKSYPDAQAVLVDFSQPMLELARNNLAEYKNVRYLQADLSGKEWMDKIGHNSPFDAAVSGFAIHNFRKGGDSYREFYSQIFDLLRPGGLLVNIELVGVASGWVNSVSHELAADAITQYHRKKGSSRNGNDVLEEFGRREGWRTGEPKKYVAHYAFVENHCEWLRDVGFEDADCFFKVFTRAVVGGRRPSK